MGPTQRNNIRVLQWNARSLSGIYNGNKIGELYNFISNMENAPEILAIQETWNHKGQNLLTLPGYKSPVSFRREKGKNGGGVATFVKVGLDSEEIKITHSNKNIEVAIVRFFGTSENIDIINFYAPPDVSVTSDDLMEIYRKVGEKSIFLGDFNARHELWDEKYRRGDTRGMAMVDFLNETDYVILNSGCGTRINVENGTESAIDLTMVSAPLSNDAEWTPGDATLGSDHYPIVTSLGVRHKHVTQKPAQRWKLTKANWDLFKQKTKNMNIDFNGQDINESNTLFISEIMSACEKSIPKTAYKNNNKKTLP